jgi:hypothetical protein
MPRTAYNRRSIRRAGLVSNLWLIDPLERRTLLSGNQLVFTIPLLTANAGALIDAPTGIQVSVETAGGVPVAGNSNSITLSLGANPGGATLGGPVTESAVNGLAVFSNLSISVPRNGYTLGQYRSIGSTGDQRQLRC